MQDHLTPDNRIRTTSPASDLRLVTVRATPFNAEIRLTDQQGMITPSSMFYVRNHFAVPRIDARNWRLIIEGEVERPASLTLDEIQALPSRNLLATLECAGNGRSAMRPRIEGEPWQYGAVSTAVWTGVPLSTMLVAAGVRPSVQEVVCEGSDRGWIADDRDSTEGLVAFTRSLPLAKAMHPDTLLAYAMNGEELPAAHGYPVRLIVPGWYGMASVKWITRLSACVQPFTGFFQRDRYVLEQPQHSGRMVIPLTTIAVRSLLAWPSDGAVLSMGEHLLRGYAWSGSAPVTRVEVSADGGAQWGLAQLMGHPERYAWQPWEYRWLAAAPGRFTLSSRAIDAAGNKQPGEPIWNRLGYANNAVQSIQIVVV